jgi:uncharacterized protein (TIGR02453 family)
MPTFFTDKSLAFLRALARNNDREWFKARKSEFDAHLQQPLVSLLEHLAADMQSFAPELACSPKESTFRQYRDTRFSEDKSPLKTHIAAVFPPRGFPRHSGAGAYFQIDGQEVWIGGGLYRSEPPRLYRVREHIASNYTRLRAIVESPSFKQAFGSVTGDTLTRVPKGFPADHPAAEFLKFKDLIVSRTFPASLAATPRFYATLVASFRDAAPFIRFLNEPLR